MTHPRIRLTESADARNARMWAKYRAAPTVFDAHVVLIEWQGGSTAEASPRMMAWIGGPTDYAARKARGVPGYEALIRDHVHP